MDFLELVKEKRYSVRKFKTDKIEKEKLDYILEAGRLAPTAANFQPQRILVIQSEEGLEKVKECTRYQFGAPCVLLVCFDNTTCWKSSQNGNRNGGDVDTSIVLTHIMLAAADQGLGSTWVGAFSHDKARELFNIPEYLQPVAMLPVGYATDDYLPNPWHTKRFELGHTTFFETFDGITEGEKH